MVEAEAAPREPEVLMAEFSTVEKLSQALRWLRAEGYRQIDAFTPYPTKEVEEALELPRSPLPRIVLAGGLTGAAIGYSILYFTQVIDYPLNVGGRPDHAIPAFIPITFETGILLGALSALLGLLFLCRLPRLWHRVFEVPGFERASLDRFWLLVECSDPRFSEPDLSRKLDELGALRVVPVGEPASATGAGGTAP